MNTNEQDLTRQEQDMVIKRMQEEAHIGSIMVPDTLIRGSRLIAGSDDPQATLNAVYNLLGKQPLYAAYRTQNDRKPEAGLLFRPTEFVECLLANGVLNPGWMTKVSILHDIPVLDRAANVYGWMMSRIDTTSFDSGDSALLGFHTAQFTFLHTVPHAYERYEGTSDVGIGIRRSQSCPRLGVRPAPDVSDAAVVYSGFAVHSDSAREALRTERLHA